MVFTIHLAKVLGAAASRSRSLTQNVHRSRRCASRSWLKRSCAHSWQQHIIKVILFIIFT